MRQLLRHSFTLPPSCLAARHTPTQHSLIWVFPRQKYRHPLATCSLQMHHSPGGSFSPAAGEDKLIWSKNSVKRLVSAANTPASPLGLGWLAHTSCLQGLGWADLLHFAKRQKTKLKGRNKDKDGSEEPNRTATVSVSVKMSTLCIA